jgi:hypothetical protein
VRVAYSNAGKVLRRKNDFCKSFFLLKLLLLQDIEKEIKTTFYLLPILKTW